MSAHNAALAELVTQAPPDDATDAAPALGQVDIADIPATQQEGQARRCFCRRRKEPKLRAILPVAAEEVPAPAARPARPAVPNGTADAAAQATRGSTSTQHEERAGVRTAPAAEAASPPPAAEAAPQPAPAPAPATATPQQTPRARGAAAADLVEEAQLGPQVGPNIGRKTLVLDLDETLVHSSFRVVHSADIVITVELDGEDHRVYVRKRPGVDTFLAQVAQLYEVVVYTASMAKYANPLLDELDRESVISHRLFREACTRQPGGYVKDLSKLGRDLKDVIIIDNSPTCYALQPNNAIPIRTWRDDLSDRELLDLVPILYSLAAVEDIPMVLRTIVWTADD